VLLIAAVLALVFLIVPVGLTQQPTTPEIQSPFLSIPAVSDALRFGVPFPEFQAKDISGRAWRSEDLRGMSAAFFLRSQEPKSC
jgi:hypothetical protein